MRHILLRFNYGVEIGARLAYLGHFGATGDDQILQIADEELAHREAIQWVLAQYGLKPFFLFNWFFQAVGTSIQFACYVSPRFMLDYIARIMEAFAVFNYRKLAKLYPEYSDLFVYMAESEEEHKNYFKDRKWVK